ncbi:VacB/RNase II family 3'-5' exoribonuclease [bacterium]|nr:VacB/RNase II family 3'-5' exoribonuclease [candidate division CSSED10-310 bacterium]
MSRENKTPNPGAKQVLKILDQHPQGLTCTAISRLLQLDRRSVRATLKKLENRQDVLKTASCYISNRINTNRVIGLFRRKYSGAGLLHSQSTEHEIFINRKQGYYLFDGDQIEAVFFRDKSGVVKGSVLSVIKRRDDPIAGYYRKTIDGDCIEPLDPRVGPPIRIIGNRTPGIHGQVVVSVLEPASNWRDTPKGRIIKVLGHRFDFGVQTEILTRKFGIPDRMPDAVIREAEQLIELSSHKSSETRRDLRALPTITVDPKNARDYDDALSLIDIPNGVRLGVHIADVSHYIPIGSLVDKEAFKRGTSVYLPERAIHMLPETLATEICSLLPNQDRLAVSVLMDFDADGRIMGGDVCESIIRSDARLTYADFLEASGPADTGTIIQDPDIRLMCSKLSGLCEKLLIRRIDRGVLDLDMPESWFELDENGKICGVHKKSRSLAEQTIEEFMIAANVFIAQLLENRKVPYLRRVHDTPDPSEINELKESLRQLGLIPPQNPLDPNEVRLLLSSIGNDAIRSVASHRILRAMRRAVYSATDSGHFGLALEFYTQFTSPIRRYPDLEVHRSVKAALGIPGYPVPNQAELSNKASVLCDYERRAQEAEWEAVRIDKIRFMQSRIAERFTGTITHVMEFGAYIELDEPFVEGFLPLALMNDYLYFNPRLNCLVDSGGKIRLKSGQTVSVVLETADLDRGSLDFRLG